MDVIIVKNKNAIAIFDTEVLVRWKVKIYAAIVLMRVLLANAKGRHEQLFSTLIFFHFDHHYKFNKSIIPWSQFQKIS